MKFNSTLFQRLPYLICLLTTVSAQAQNYDREIRDYLKQVQTQWHLTDTDIDQWEISDQYFNPSTGITHTYLHQQVGGIRIFGAVSSMAIRNDAVVYFANRFLSGAAARINAAVPGIDAGQAIAFAAGHLELPMSGHPLLLERQENRNQWIFDAPDLASQPIRVELVYVQEEHALRLAWDVSIAVKGSTDWWNVRVDAQEGHFLEKNNWTTYCDFDIPTIRLTHSHRLGQVSEKPVETSLPEWLAGSYNVYPIPLEAPSFGPRELLTDPHSPTASPHGWHDTNNVPGAEYTITRGNNVYAYEDANDDNQPGYAPDGGASLLFDFPIDFAFPPEENRDAIITNLFYMNNIVHDVLYHHGFDEASGNFQSHNYGNGGQGGDHVLAEAQDGGGNNNANFATPGDGGNGRMQMYLWSSGSASTLTVNEPQVIAGDYASLGAAFGPAVTSPITSDAVLVQDGTAPANDGCEAFVNAGALEGKIAVIDRGLCTFVVKVQAAEAAGAIAVVVINNVAGDPITMGGTADTNIPAVMISQTDGALIKAQINAGQTVNITLNPGPGAGNAIDGSLDNGIIAHEYGHGLSNRLTGGPSNSGCLSNGEQGGEGWSDWLSLIMSIEPGDQGPDARGIGTYALGQLTSGGGIRRYPYSTNMSINPQTYGDLALSTEVHDIGEIWCQALWDMTWNLIDAEGYDPDLFNGNGGNNTALHLVIEAMKLQPCNPGFIDGRDALLAADELLYNNAHRCMIWDAFAQRGFGIDASQGSADIAGDEVENFQIPTFCQNPVLPPVAQFSVDPVSSCFGHFQFTDLSTEIPQQWLWDFGDGTTSNAIQPQHSYASPGIYTVQLTVTNTLGSDTFSLQVEYSLLQPPLVTGITEICEGTATTLSANITPGNTAIWSANGNPVAVGESFVTPALTGTTTYSVIQSTSVDTVYVGPEDYDFGTGNYHNNTGFEGRLLFEAFVPFTLKSVFVNADGDGVRTITLYDADNNPVETVNVFIPAGESRIQLDLDIQLIGQYSIGNLSQNLYRNNSGAQYPYEVPGVVSIYSSNSTSGPLTYYYYFYDWEVVEIGCESDPTAVVVTVTPGPVAAFSASTDDLNAAFTDLSSGNPTIWSWNFGDGSPLSQEQHPIHVYQQAGNYTVILTVSNGTCSTTVVQEITVESSAGIGMTDPSGLVVFPNPASDWVQIEWRGEVPEQWEMRLIDLQGKTLLRNTYDNIDRSIRLPATAFSGQICLLYVISTKGIWVTRTTFIK